MNTNPGDRPLSLAGHLHSLASMLKTGAIEYNWVHQEQCNCGLLARSITGLTSWQLRDSLRPLLLPGKEGVKTWAQMASRHCPITGEPVNEIFKKLHAAGLTFADFGELERLSNPVVVRKMLAYGYTITETKKRFFFDDQKIERPFEGKDVTMHNASHVAAYMKAWAALIEEHHAARPVPAVPATEDQRLEAVELRPLVGSK